MAFDIDKIIENNVPVHLQTTNTVNFIKSFVNVLITNEDDIDKLNDSIFIDTAAGSELDDIGLLFKLARLAGENDASYRSRVKAFYQVALASGTVNGISSAISLLLNISEDIITVSEIYDYKQQQLIADMESNETWTGTGVSTDANYRYHSSQGLKLTGGSTITASLTKSISIENNEINDADMFQVWAYISDSGLIDSVKLSFSDGAVTSIGTISNYADGQQLLTILKTDCTNYTTIDWSAITSIDIIAEFNSSSTIYVDYLTFGAYVNTMKFNVSVELDEGVDLNTLASINSVINNSKAAGIYYGSATFSSAENIFRINLSTINGGDKFL